VDVQAAEPAWGVLEGMTMPTATTRWKESCTMSPREWRTKKGMTSDRAFVVKLLLETIR
jgi:hypothetical protein